MDIILKGKKSDIQIEYFGQQSRFFEFFEMVVDQLLDGKGIYAETNSGSNGNAFMFAKKGYDVITNDASEYSFSVAKAIMSDDIPTKIQCKYDWLEKYADSYVKRASVFAANVELYGYNANIPENENEELHQKIEHYIKYFSSINESKVRAYNSYNEDLFSYLKYRTTELFHPPFWTKSGGGGAIIICN